MAKRLSRRAIREPSGAAPRLGTVVRFTPQATRTGIKQLEASGFRVASSKDFRSAAAVPSDLDGADVQYFERFGIAIVRRDGERLRPMVEKAMQQKVVSNVRPERTYHALGAPGVNRADIARRRRSPEWRTWIRTICGATATASTNWSIVCLAASRRRA